MKKNCKFRYTVDDMNLYDPNPYHPNPYDKIFRKLASLLFKILSIGTFIRKNYISNYMMDDSSIYHKIFKKLNYMHDESNSTLAEIEPQISMLSKVLEGPIYNGGDAVTTAVTPVVVERKTIGSYSRATSLTIPVPAIVIPPLPENTKATKIKGYIYSCMTYFHGLETENPYKHMASFNSLINEINELTNRERVVVILFLKTLKDKAKEWLRILLAKSIASWDELTTAFLHKYFPIYRTLEIRKNIMGFIQGSLEEFYEC